MKNIYQYELAKARLRPRVRELVFEKMLENPKTHDLAEVIKMLDDILCKEMNKPSLAPVPENRSTDLKYEE
jgi:signal recognition particle subunit SEC65